MNKIKIGSFLLLSFSCFVAQSCLAQSIVDAPNLMAAGQITEYAYDIRPVVKQMLLNGIKADDLDFTLHSHPGHIPSKNYVFEQKEAYELLDGPVSDAFDGQKHYVFSRANKILGIKADVPEILFIAWPIKKEVCFEINKGFGLAKDSADRHILSPTPDVTPLHHESSMAINEINTLGHNFACIQDKNNVRYFISSIVEK